MTGQTRNPDRGSPPASKSRADHDAAGLRQVLRRPKAPGRGVLPSSCRVGHRPRGIGRCKLHGGNTRTQRAGAAAVAVERGAQRALHGHRMEPVTDPIRQLSLLAGELVALKDVLGEKVGELKVWSYTDNDEREHVRALIAAYERVLAQCHRVLADMARLDLDARLVRLREAQADLIERVVEAVLSAKELGLDRARQAAAKGVFARELARDTGAA